METNFPNSYARVSYDESILSARQIIRAISAAGYKPQLIEAGPAVKLERNYPLFGIPTLRMGA